MFSNKLLKLILVVVMALPSLGQTAFWTDRAVGVFPFGSGGVTGLVPIQYGPVRICTVPATGSPCSPVASVTDINGSPLTVQGGNFGQLTTDVVGRFAFGCTPGNYLVQVAASSSNTPLLSYPVTCPSGSSLLSNNNTFTGTNVFTQSLIFGGPAPWFDVTAPAFGAKCDSVTDDTTAIQNAWNAAKAVGAGAFVYFPPKSTDCIINGTLDFHASNGIRFGGLGGGTSNLPLPRLVYTGTAATFINCVDCQNLHFQNIGIQYNNAAFAGNLFDMSTSIGAGANVFDSVTFAGLSSASKLAANLVLATSSQKDSFYRCAFGWAVNAISNAGGNVLTVEDSVFGSGAGVISGTDLLSTSAGARIQGNNFEMFNAPNTTVVFDSSSQGCFGCLFAGNWMGDMPVGYTGTLIKATGGMAFVGNTFQGQPSTTLMSINGGQDGLTFTGNATQQAFSVVFSSNVAVTNVNITGNKWAGTLTTFYSGSLPTSGIVTDNTQITTTYGTHKATTQFLGPVGSLSAAGLAVGTANKGLFVNGNGFTQMTANGTAGPMFWSNLFALGSGMPIQFTATADPNSASADTSISRDASGVVDFGTGAQGSTAGGIKLTTITTVEGTAPTGLAGSDRCYGDSTAHALECSYNNGPFIQLAQIIKGTSAAFATATTAGTCVQNTTAVTGATTAMTVNVSPVSTPGVGAQWSAFVSSAGNVTINECAVAASAGGTIAFNIRVFP